MRTQKDVIVGGLTCLDMILPVQPGKTWKETVDPGRLSETGPVQFATGGAVPNTGLTLRKLGLRADLRGAVGNDAFGEIVLDLLRAQGPVNWMTKIDGESTSYSAVINPAGYDRAFLHHRGVNDILGPEHFADVIENQPKIFHFGYPPLMRRMYQDGGRELAALMKSMREAGITTSLDMSLPDANGEAGQVNWYRILENVLPHVSIFTPSLDEIRFMMNQILPNLPYAKMTLGEELHQLSEKLLGFGPTIVLIKLGDRGLYLQTKTNGPNQHPFKFELHSEFAHDMYNQLISPCFKVEAKGTTGAGDSTIGGFLAALLKGHSPADCLNFACGVGACCVEQPDAISGILPMDKTWDRIKAGWERSNKLRSGTEIGEGWKWNDNESIWYGPKHIR